MYKEILELAKFCEENGIEIVQGELLDGYGLRFNNGGDVVQHMGSYGNSRGCVEFGYTGFFRSRFLLQHRLKKQKNS